MDGDGWSVCALGHRHWGRYGAAGLLVVAPGPTVLMQHRAPWSHGGDTWGVPGGARRRTETALEAAEIDAALAVEAERESLALRWVPIGDVTDLRLHDGFASAWPLLRPRLAC